LFELELQSEKKIHFGNYLNVVGACGEINNQTFLPVILIVT